MKVFYIDVYFFINFTVDLLALYFSALLTKAKSTSARLIFASAIGAIFACIVALNASNVFLFLTSLIVSSVIITLIFTYRESIVRKIKFFVAFLCNETFIGGAVGFLFSLLDKYLAPKLTEDVLGTENRNMLILSLLILLSYGVLKLLYITFSGSKFENNEEFTISFLGKEINTVGIIDSANFLRDPMDLKPVVLLKKDIFKKLGLDDDFLLSENKSIRSRIRLIPSKSVGGEKILAGIRCDYILIKRNNFKIYNVVVVADNKEGTYSGFKALLPAALIDDI